MGAQAKAQAAAGIEVGLGLKVGDFIQLVRENPEALGLPLELILLLLEEVSVGGIVEVHVAASAMAYASITITGNVIDQPGRPAGFYYTVDAGLGLAAGVGSAIGLVVGVVAIVFNILSIRRVWRADFRLKWPVTIFNSTIIVMLLVLFALDLADLS